MRWALALVLLAPALSGCLLSPSDATTDEGSKDSPGGSGSNSTVSNSPIGKPASTSTSTAKPNAPNSTTSGTVVDQPREWPEPALATIRPGASLDGGGCTANFVFTSLDNATVYLGTAAHCFSNDLNTQTNGCLADIQPLGTKRSISGASRAGTLVYSSWTSMQASQETSDMCNGNDFALLQIHEDDEAAVSPAMWRYGGPTGIADASEIVTGGRVLSYGNSGSRPEDSALSPREGVITLPATGCGTRVMFPNPAIPGDSGSPVILGSGLALGNFVSIELAPLAGQGHVCRLSTMLNHAAAAGFEVQLATWELLDDGLP